MEHEGLIRLMNAAAKPLDVDIRLPVESLRLDHRVSVVLDERVSWSRVLEGGQSAVIELEGVTVPQEGLVLELLVEGADIPLVLEETVVFGTEHATMKLGDVQVDVRSGV